MTIDLYELSYRNYKINNINKPEKNISASKEITKSILNVLGSIYKNPSVVIKEEINFSDIICNLMPVFDEETQNISYKYEYIIDNGFKDKNPIEYIERFKKFDVNTLPLIDVAKQLNITVEKSSILNRAYGRFIPAENKIVLCTDYVPTFIHELVHAIDHNLGNTFENYYLDDIRNFDELVAEASSLVICKTYNIKIDESYTLNYLNNYSSSKINSHDFINRVMLICEYVENCTRIV